MKREYIVFTLFTIIAAVFFYLFYRTVIPFFIPICWAAVFVILFNPLYEWLVKRIKRPTLAALIMCFLIIVLIIGPVTYLCLELVSQASDAFTRVSDMYNNGELQKYFNFNVPWLNSLNEKLSPFIDFSKINLNEIVKDSMGKVSGIVVDKTTWLIANSTKTAMYFVMMLFSIFYFFKDGRALVELLKHLMPLSMAQTNDTFDQLHDLIKATMYSLAVVALLQGFIGGLLFWIMGINTPVFWGAAMAFMSVLPIVGSAIIYIPAGLILIIGGSTVKGLLLIIISTLTITQVDHFVRPLIVSGKTSMHPLLLFFSIAGGIAFFGLLGIVLGPLVAAVFMTILEIIELKLHPGHEADHSVPE
ncbi:MAG TPA: AI-2E family transporter [Candidatus Acidoferrum sp.]|nr:AI-2E family transporter [Candidatus Acidoferrum sp.]